MMNSIMTYFYTPFWPDFSFNRQKNGLPVSILRTCTFYFSFCFFISISTALFVLEDAYLYGDRLFITKHFISMGVVFFFIHKPESQYSCGL